MMNITHELTRKFNDENPEWGIQELTGEEESPLIKAGVLRCFRQAKQYACPSCDFECPGVVDYFERNQDDDHRPALAAHCLRDGHLIEIDPIKLSIWQYDPKQMAELISKALGCEKAERSPSGEFYDLGLSQYRFGKFSRQICVAKLVDDRFFQRLNRELPNNESYLLLVGKLTCPVDDQQLKRRIFTFDEILRFQPDGRLKIAFDVISSQMEEGASLKKVTRKRADLTATEEKIAEYLLEITDLMLRTKDETGMRQIRKECLAFEVIGEKVGVNKSKISENYLGKECLRQDSLKPHRLLYKLLKNPDLFYIVRDFAKSQNCCLSKMSVQKVFAGLCALAGKHNII